MRLGFRFDQPSALLDGPEYLGLFLTTTPSRYYPSGHHHVLPGILSNSLKVNNTVSKVLHFCPTLRRIFVLQFFVGECDTEHGTLHGPLCNLCSVHSFLSYRLFIFRHHKSLAFSFITTLETGMREICTLLLGGRYR